MAKVELTRRMDKGAIFYYLELYASAICGKADKAIAVSMRVCSNLYALVATRRPERRLITEPKDCQPMPIFFFHIRAGSSLAEDPEGIDLPNLELAYTEAVAMARE